MKRLLFLLCALLASAPVQAAPTIRGLFVGIDHYRYSSTQIEGAKLRDLRGAVADAQAIKIAFHAAYGLDFDSGGEGCKSSNVLSITLTDECATRKAIIAAFETQIRASRPQDTLIFYYAGHGSTLIDDQANSQAPGFFSTIIPHDGRNPADRAGSDLLDVEIDQLITVANARGINVLTIYDSCHSASGTRAGGGGGIGEGENRGVETLHLKPLIRQVTSLSPSGPGGGYRAHLAAAGDTEEARELRENGAVNGVFTTALSQVLIAMPDATFGDIATATRLKVLQRGHNEQTPSAEGALQATLGGKISPVALFDATQQGDNVALSAGSLLGMSIGSAFALFDSDLAALADTPKPLARGTITALDSLHATITLDNAPAALLPARLRARETKHSYGEQVLRVSVPGAETPLMARLVAALRSLEFVRIEEPAQFRFSQNRDDGSGYVVLSAMDRTTLARLGNDADPAFAERLRDALTQLYNVQRLLALPAKTDSEAEISFCIDADLTYDIRECPPVGEKGRRLLLDQRLLLTIANMSETTPRYLYHFIIDDRYGISQLIPTRGGIDPQIAPGRAQRKFLALNSVGFYRFVTITSSEQISLSTLQQAGLRWNYDGDCDAEKEPPGLCTAISTGGRGGTASVGEWTITVDDALVVNHVEESGR